MSTTTAANSPTLTRDLTVLKHLRNGRNVTVTAQLVDLPVDKVKEIATDAGWPSTAQISVAIEHLEAALTGVPTKAAVTPGVVEGSKRRTANPTPTAPPKPTPREHRAAESAEDETPAPSTAFDTTYDAGTDSIEALLGAGDNAETTKIRRQAERTRDAITKLRDLLDEHAETEKLRREIANLEKRLAAKKAALKADKAVTTAGPAPADIRAWATETGLEVPATGRIPADVRAAYDAAHPTD